MVWCRLHRHFYAGLTATGFEVWFDHVSMSRESRFPAGIENADSACDRLLLIGGSIRMWAKALVLRYQLSLDL